MIEWKAWALISTVTLALAVTTAAGVSAAEDSYEFDEDDYPDSVDATLTEFDADGNETGNVSFSSYRSFDGDAVAAWTWWEPANHSESPYPDAVESLNLSLEGDTENVSQSADGWDFAGIQSETYGEADVSDVNLSTSISIHFDVDSHDAGAWGGLVDDSGNAILTVAGSSSSTQAYDGSDSIQISSTASSATAVVDANETATLYLDGGSEKSSGSLEVDLANASHFRVGGDTGTGDRFSDEMRDASVYDRALSADEASLLYEGHRVGDLSPPSDASDARELNENDSIQFSASELKQAEVDVWIEKESDDEWVDVGAGLGSISSTDTTVEWDVEENGTYRYQTSYSSEVSDAGFFSGGSLSGFSITIPVLDIELTADNRNTMLAGAGVLAALLFWIPGFRYFGRRD